MVAETKTLLGELQHAASGRRGTRLELSEGIIGGIVAFLDAVVLMAMGAAVFLAYLDASRVDVPLYVLAAVVTTLVLLQAFRRVGLYDMERIATPTAQIFRVAGAMFAGFMVLVAVAFLVKQSESFSRVWAVAWLVSAIPVVILVRMVIAKAISICARRGLLTQRIMVFGADDVGGEFLARVLRNNAAQPWNDVVGVFDDRGEDRLPPERAQALSGSLEGLLERARTERVDRVVVALPWNGPNKRVDEILSQLGVLPARVDLVVHDELAKYLKREVVSQFGIPTIRIQDRPIGDWNALAKRAFDLLASSCILLAIWPLLVLVAAAVKIDSRGPVLFRQNRFGFNDELIPVYKFRTMYADQADTNAERLVSRGDPRITRIGNFLRRTSLDELPQLFNVFLGSMSLVGPRPHATRAKADGILYQEVIENYAARHRVKPGLTGWAQVNGWRGETDTQEKIIRRVEHDLWYIANWSIWLDIKILFLTAFAVLKGENAY